TISAISISGNTAVGGGSVRGGYGGGIDNTGTLTINNSTVSGNLARKGRNFVGGEGGGIGSSGPLTINNSTLSGNVGVGGGIFNSGPLTISNSTLGGNFGGGLFWSATLQDNIFAKSFNCPGQKTPNGHNPSKHNTCNFTGPGDMNNINPNLGSLQNNGGPTQTMALPSGSPAVDAGNPSGCTDSSGHLLKTDQRGMPRPDPEDTGGCDMGAYERQSVATGPILTGSCWGTINSCSLGSAADPTECPVRAPAIEPNDASGVTKCGQPYDMIPIDTARTCRATNSSGQTIQGYCRTN